MVGCIINNIKQKANWDTSHHELIFSEVSINLGSGIMPSSYIRPVTFSVLFLLYHFSQQLVFLVLKVLRLLSSDKWWCMYTQFGTSPFEFNWTGKCYGPWKSGSLFFSFGNREEKHPALIWDFNIWFGSIFWLSQPYRKDKSLDMHLVL